MTDCSFLDGLSL